MKFLGLVILLAACSRAPTAPVHNQIIPAKVVPDAHQTTLETALRANGFKRVELAIKRRDMTYSFPADGPSVKDGAIILVETAGWSASPSVFARRDSDGMIVLVSPRPNKIVDRHVAAGCQRFFGGRAWFEEVAYRLPDGERFGGIVEVAYDEHVEVRDYSDRQPDGSPCPPPMID